MRASASDGLIDDVAGFRSGNVPATSVHFSEIPPQSLRNLLSPHVGNGRHFKGADANCLTFLYSAPKQAFDHGFLLGGEVFSFVDR
jgi:hypothetical protein